MSRRIVTENLQAASGRPVDTYIDRVVKNIPADVIAAWLAAAGAIDQATDLLAHPVIELRQRQPG